MADILRTTHVVVEALLVAPSAGRTTQVVVEQVASGVPASRTTQVVVEVLTGTPSSRTTQLLVEQAAEGVPASRTSHVLIEQAAAGAAAARTSLVTVETAAKAPAILEPHAGFAMRCEWDVIPPPIATDIGLAIGARFKAPKTRGNWSTGLATGFAANLHLTPHLPGWDPPIAIGCEWDLSAFGPNGWAVDIGLGCEWELPIDGKEPNCRTGDGEPPEEPELNYVF